MTRAPSRPLIAAGIAAAGLVAVQVMDPAARDVPLCPFHELTGLWCPLCGGLRAAYALTRLDVSGALRYNAVLVLALPLLLFFWWDWLRRDRRLPRAALVALWVVALAFTITRNLPFAEALRPPA